MDPPNVWSKEQTVRNDRASKRSPRQSNTDYRQRKEEIRKQYFENLGETFESEVPLGPPVLKTYEPRSEIPDEGFLTREVSQNSKGTGC